MFTKNLNFTLVCITLVLCTASNGYSQTASVSSKSNIPIYGASERTVLDKKPSPVGFYKIPEIIGSNSTDIFATTTFTFSDIVVFSYFNSTEITIYDQSNTVVDNYTLNEDKYHVSSPGEGIYRVEGTKTYSVLIGDPILNNVLGYYAVNENGSPLSTKLNTYMPQQFSNDHFIIFAYEDNTEYQLKNLDTDELISAGILNEGEHFVYEGNNVFLSLTSNKPTSALSYNDQGYYYPASNGTFTGTLFYGFSGYIGSWPNGVIVTAYEDNTNVTIKNTETDGTIWTGSLNEGQVYAEVISTDIYVTVEADKPVTVANTPYAYWSSSYAYLTRHINKDGFGIGALFYVPTIAGRFDVFSYADGNNVKITDLDSELEFWSGTLDEGDGYSFNSVKARYKVVSSENVSVITSWGGAAGADFMPLNYATTLPDLSISASDISFDPDPVNVGNPVVISADIHNYSSISVENVIIQFFDGNPNSGGIQIGEDQLISAINTHSMETASIDWIAPDIPEVHFIHVMIDPNNTITESNESNNIASKPLIPNEDLLPPLSVTIDAPFALEIVDGEITPNPFDVTATIFNNGDVEAINVVATMNSLPTGLELDASSNTAVQNLGNLGALQSTQVTWTIHVTGDASGILVYSMLFNADNADVKTVSRGVNVPDITPPSAPEGFNVVSSGDSIITVAWNSNPEPDVFGYLLYYDNDASGPPYEGSDAVESSSPVDVANNLTFTLTGLDPTKTYYLNLKAYDTTPNLSDFTEEVSAIPSGIPPGEDSPSITSINDVPHDQGGKILIEWSASQLDNNVNDLPFYSIWRALPEGALLKIMAISPKDITLDFEGPAFRIETVNGEELTWEWIANQPAHRFANYSYAAETLYDSSSISDGKHYFLVSSHTSDPDVFFDSEIDSGYSVDNLAPLAPKMVTGNYNSEAKTVTVHWNANTETDLHHYLLYRNTSSDFDPDTLTTLATLKDTLYVDITPLPGSAFYAVFAQDIHDNVSIKSNLAAILSAPSIPTLLSPESNATGISANPTFSWNPSTGAESYRLQVSTNKDFSTIDIDQSEITETSYSISGLLQNNLYYWHVSSVNSAGESDWSDVWSFTTVTTGIDKEEKIPKTYTLNQNYPNPFNPETTIRFQLPELTKVELEIFNILGEKIYTIVKEQKNAGYYQVKWDGRNDFDIQVPAGIYLYRLRTDKFVQIKRMLFLK